MQVTACTSFSTTISNESIPYSANSGRLWHNPDMPTPLLSVRYRVRSGKHLLAASISAFDPQRTSNQTSRILLPNWSKVTMRSYG